MSKRKGRGRDTELVGLSNDELLDLARSTTDKQLRRRLNREAKFRGLRNRQRRAK